MLDSSVAHCFNTSRVGLLRNTTRCEIGCTCATWRQYADRFKNKLRTEETALDLHTLTPASPTPLDVLDVLRDQHRQCGCDPGVDPDIELTFDTTVADWRCACDLLEWRQLAEAENAYWKAHIPLREWKAALVPDQAWLQRL